ncbi:MAG: asparagine synthase (glutamine-hydrolyzing) [Chloroflexota bacterium]
MCGIAGIFGINGELDVEKIYANGRGILPSMTNELYHRGPDSDGYYIDNRIALGFRRLSIVDLSANGDQPFFNEDCSIAMVCNGEIFNYKELKDYLLSKGHAFRSTCDIEVLPHLYEEFGIDFLNKLNAQFAAAIYDKKKGEFFLARDPVGIAPLFWTASDGKLLFASEMKAILKYPSVRKEVNLKALDQLFAFPSIASPETIFKNIHAMRPGHFLHVKNGEISVRKYRDLDYPAESELRTDIDISALCEELDEKLNRAVKLRLNADVPVGCYISGGLDSSLIASLARKHIDSAPLHSFGIGFDDPAIDERSYQRAASEKVNSIHHEIVFDPSATVDMLRRVIRHAETPLKETYDVCSLALSGEVRSNGLKVILTGEGADELFAGYVGYGLDLSRSTDDYSDEPEELLDRRIRQRLWGDPDFFYERNYYEFNEMRQSLYSANVSGEFDSFNCTNASPIDIDLIKGRHVTHKRSFIDFKLRIADHLLADHGDRVTFANSVEGRYPFLDVELIDFIKNIHPSLHINGGTEKYILKKTAEKYLPDRITKRKKFAFVAPGSASLLQNDDGYIDHILSFETIKRQGYFNPDSIERLRKMYARDGFSINQTFDNDLLMIVITFGIFLDEFNI